jgi:hypothetical protein
MNLKMKRPYKFLSALITILLPATAMAQRVEMADKLRAEGKIYVVVAIILVILSGFIIYLFSMDRRLSKMEKMIDSKKQTKQRA